MQGSGSRSIAGHLLRDFAKHVTVRIAFIVVVSVAIYTSVSYYVTGQNRDYYRLLPAEIGYPTLVSASSELSCYSAIFSLKDIAADTLARVLKQDRLVSRLYTPTPDDDGPSDQYVFDAFRRDKVEDDLSLPSNTLSLGVACGHDRWSDARDAIIGNVRAGGIVYVSFNGPQDTVMLIDTDKRLLVLAAYN